MSALPVLKVGIAGLGRLGRRHAENLSRHVPGAALVAACCPLESELTWAGQTLGISHLYHDYEALLEHDGLDAVFLVTPTCLHAKHIIQALRSGKHVFCEKLLSLELEDCHRVNAEAAQHPNLKVMIGFVRRFDASYQDAYKRIQSGSIGRPIMVHTQTCDQYDADGFFVKFAPTSGGIFLDCSVHDIDWARWLLGNPKPVRVFASGTIAIHQGLQACGDVDNGVAICEFDNGRIATFYASRTMPHGHETVTEITGTTGRLTVGRNTRRNRLEIADAMGIRHECIPSFFERFEAAFLTEAIYFVDAVREHQPLSLTLANAVEATRLGIALRESLQSNLPVAL